MKLLFHYHIPLLLTLRVNVMKQLIYITIIGLLIAYTLSCIRDTITTTTNKIGIYHETINNV